MRELTQKDLPYLQKAHELWKISFPFSIDRAQLILWLEQYDNAVFEKGMAVTASWFKRKGTNQSPEDVYAYATATMRNIQRAHDRGKVLFNENGGAA